MADRNLICTQVPEDFSVHTDWKEWGPYAVIPLKPKDGFILSKPGDLSASACLAWNSKGLFVIVHVEDDLFSPSDSLGTFWIGDSVQIAIDPLNDTTLEKSDENDISIGAADLPFGKTVIAVQVPANFPRSQWDIPFEVKNVTNQKTYLIQFPWSYLKGLIPLEKTKFKLNISVNENDGFGRRGWLELSEGIGTGLDLSKFLTVTFSHRDTNAPQVYIRVDSPVIKQNRTSRISVILGHCQNAETVKLYIGDEVFTGTVAENKPFVDIPFDLKITSQPGPCTIRAEIFDRDGKPIVGNSIPVVLVESIDGDTRIAEAIQTLNDVQKLIAQMNNRQINTDYLQLRANCFLHGIRIAQLANRKVKKDPDNGLFNSVFINSMKYLKVRSKRLLNDARVNLSHPPSHPKALSRADLHKPWRIENGNIYAGDQPIMLHGFIWCYGAKDPSYSLTDCGLNLQTIDPGPRSTLKSSLDIPPDLKKTSPIAPLRRCVRLGQTNGEVFDLHTSPHYIPGWFSNKAASRKGTYSWMDTPDGKKLLEKHYTALNQAFGDLKSIKVADLANEWVFCDYSDEALEEFRQWLKDRHGTIDVLNKRWEVHFQDFAEIPNPFPNKMWSPEGVYLNRGAYWDWCCFSAQKAARVVRWMQDSFKEAYPSLLTHIKIILSSRDYRPLSQNFQMGIDPQQILPITDLLGTDASYVRGKQWIGTLFSYDYMKSICPEKPIFNSEWHCLPFNDGIAPEEIRRGLFQLTVHGERMNNLFLNISLQKPDFWDSQHGAFNISQDPDSFESFAVTSADLSRLAEEFGSFENRRPSVLLFYDNAADFGVPGSNAPPGVYQNRMMSLYKSLIPLDVKVGIVTEKMLNEKCPAAGVIVLANAVHVSDETVKRLERFVSEGGHLILAGKENLTADHYGLKRDSEMISFLQQGKNIYRGPFSAKDSLERWQRILAEAEVDIPFTIQTARPGDVELLSTSDADGRPLIFIANTSRKVLEFQLSGKSLEKSSMINLLTMQALSSSPIKLNGNQTMLISCGE